MSVAGVNALVDVACFLARWSPKVLMLAVGARGIGEMLRTPDQARADVSVRPVKANWASPVRSMMVRATEHLGTATMGSPLGLFVGMWGVRPPLP